MTKNIVEAIGNTPLVNLRAGNGNIYAKMEMLNPFAMKDRVARNIIKTARENGDLKDGQPIIESSSGTMALGLALVGTYYNHPVHIITDARTDPITIAKLKALGCKVEAVTEMGPEGWQSTRLGRLADLLNENPDAFCPHQYENPENPNAYSELAEELVNELGTVDYLVASVGSGGSLCGTARRLKQLNPSVKIIAVDAVGSVIFEQTDIPDRLQGGHGNSVVPENVDLSVIDEVHWISDAECFDATIDLAKDEKVFAGNSSGAVYRIMRWISSNVPNDKVIAGIFPDSGDRYHNTVYSEKFRSEKNLISNCRTAPIEVKYGVTVNNWSYAKID